ncbi:hypothetical protein [Mesorhizobium hawassense]|uniref:hypothetical protein n=1 Tax=Mesorhizobium hawassense TaxID=1209954 RepID=UPI0011BE9B5A|nr:hypothetical protein [Mesorhizobium hawassense]
MIHFHTLKAALAALAMLAGSAVFAPLMSQPLKEPQAVPLDFLAWIDKDPGWLRQQLAALGVVNAPKIQNTMLETTDLATLKAANRIRAFAYLAAKGQRPPFYDLALGGPSGPVRCITQFPLAIVPGLGPLDFARPSFPAAAADPAILKACTVQEAKNAPYAGMDRASFREQYFDLHGLLKKEHQTMNADPAFMAKAIDLGFFLNTEDFSGVLTVE